LFLSTEGNFMAVESNSNTLLASAVIKYHHSHLSGPGKSVSKDLLTLTASSQSVGRSKGTKSNLLMTRVPGNEEYAITVHEFNGDSVYSAIAHAETESEGNYQSIIIGIMIFGFMVYLMVQKNGQRKN